MTGSLYPLTPEDHLEIAEVIALWAAHEDRGEADQWAGLFTEDGVSESASGKLLVGHAALAANARARWAKPGGQEVAHLFAAPHIVATDKGATARHYGVLVGRGNNGGIGTVSLRTCHLRKDAGQWKIYAREIAHLPLVPIGLPME